MTFTTRKYSVSVWCTCDDEPLHGDAVAQRQRRLGPGVVLQSVPLVAHKRREGRDGVEGRGVHAEHVVRQHQQRVHGAVAGGKLTAVRKTCA